MDEESWPVLRGRHCALSVLLPGDAEDWKAGEDDEQRRWFEFPGPAPIENVRRAIDDWRRHWREDGPVRHWGIWCDGDLAGGVELRDLGDRRAAISYVVFPLHRRRGLASEAIRLAVVWGFDNLGIDAVVAIAHEDNRASRATVESCGFRLDGPADPSEHTESGPHVRYTRVSTSGGVTRLSTDGAVGVEVDDERT